MRRREATLALPLTALLAACSSLPRDTSAIAGDTLSGRLALRVDAPGEEQPRSVVAAFELRGAPEAGRLDLSRSISGIVALDDVADGIRRLRERDSNPIRILVQP